MRIAGGTAILLAANSCTSGPNYPDPRLPWHSAETETDPMRFALAHALLAPNPHNRQPWMVDLLSPTEAILYCDPTKDLPATDPFDRQITIGLGCFLELFTMAAANQGYRAELDLFPEGSDQVTLDNRPIAKLQLHLDDTIQSDPLFAQVFARRTNRGVFTEQKPTLEDLNQIVESNNNIRTGYAISEPEVAALRALAVEAARIEFETPHTYMESVHLMRIGNQEIAANPDGLSLEGPAMGLLNKIGIVTRETLADPTSSAFKQGLQQYQKAANSSAAFVWIITPDNSREQQIAAGRAYIRQNLAATELGLSMHPLSQALQEYPEMAEMLTQVHGLTGSTGQRLQMFARLGYAKSKQPAPRYPLSAKIITHGKT
ncbi:MAG: twin-arginine translocation pathway signal protein [Robiginitomaculum sp.]|nr:MAG: twin-arginine translocation pathway signal protein [Robiginitomaculum sp.]